MSASAVSEGYMSVIIASGAFSEGKIRLLRDAVAICDSRYITQGVAGSLQLHVPPPGVFMLDAVAAGTYVYQVQAKVFDIATECSLINVRMIAYEI